MLGASVTVSVRTVQRKIIDMSFRRWRPTYKLLLNAQHNAVTFSEACQNRHWSVDVWKHVVWSDESRFQLYGANGRVRVGRKPHEPMDSTYHKRLIQYGGAPVIIWGGYSWRDMGTLIRLEMILRGDRYVYILSDYLHPFMPYVLSDRFAQFHLDSGTCRELLACGSKRFARINIPRHVHYLTYMGCYTTWCSDEITNTSNFYEILETAQQD